LSVEGQQDWAVVAFADGEVDRACGAWYEWDHGGLVALADDSQRPVAALERKVLDVGRTCL
jgi:hypothetical protein